MVDGYYIAMERTGLFVGDFFGARGDEQPVVDLNAVMRGEVRDCLVCRLERNVDGGCF